MKAEDYDVLVKTANKFRAERNPNDNIRESVKKLCADVRAETGRGLKNVAEGVELFSSIVAKPLTSSHGLDYSAITPQMREAYELAYPNVPLVSLTDRSPEQIRGVLNGWKGKYFEVLVRDELNHRNWLGDIHLAPGQVARLADQPNQPGWDLRITNADGSPAHELQLKATNSLSYIKENLERYPDIQILTTAEVLDTGSHPSVNFDQSVVPTNISNEQLTEQITAPVEHLLDTATQLDDLLDFLPGLPFVIVTLDEGRKVLMCGKTVAAALESGGERFASSGAALAVGGTLAFFDCGVLSVPAVLLVKARVSRQFTERRMIKKMEIAISELRSATRRQ